MAKSIMIQGAGSNVGKTVIVAGLARACTRRGLAVRPFKPQNMSNNAAVTPDGGEIGRAQALQARAAGVEPHTDMNPVLLKPESERGAQIIVQGKRFATLPARDFGRMKSRLMAPVLESYHRLAAEADLVLVEGAGSPAEINLREGDIANMGFAEAAGIPVVLAGDIDRGGVIAQLVGTRSVLAPTDAGRIVAFMINKFRGDPGLFADGLREIENRTGWPSLGVLPWFAHMHRLPAEDVLDIASSRSGEFHIAVPKLPRIANFDDLDPLSQEPGVRITIVESGAPLPGNAHMVLIPGSKATISDLAAFRAEGWDIDLTAHLRRGGHVLGICGGYQMLGREIIDEDGTESPPGRHEGLGLLNVSTIMKPEKRLALTKATYLPSGDRVEGYEIHMGVTTGPDRDRAWLKTANGTEGAASADGLVRGCYLHGLFGSDAFRAAFLAEMGAFASGLRFVPGVEQTLNELADHLEQHVNIDRLLKMAGEI